MLRRGTSGYRCQRSMLAGYQAPPLDPAIDEALTEFVEKKKSSMPDAFG